MIRLSVLYPHTDGAHFDMAYYTGAHLNLVRERLGSLCKGGTIDRGLSGGALGTKPTYSVMTHMQFDTMSALRNVMMKHAPELMADIPAFTTIRPILQISEVMIS
jgi:uncharacterized protein (TIGR02118 family)